MRHLYTLTALLALATTAQAQNIIHQEDFEGSTSGWQTQGLWAIDGTPASVAGGAAYSGSKSLNFNDGTNYAGNARGSIASPTIRVAAGSRVTVRFRCNYETETTGTRYDQRRVLIRLDSRVVQREQLASARSVPRPNRCAGMGTWHQHALRVSVPPGSGQVRLNVDFEFNSIDAIQNDHAGWFIDDFAVEMQGGPPPPQVFDTVTRTTNDFRDLTHRLIVRADGSAELQRSSPTARFALLTGTATAAELAALEQAIQNGAIGTIPSTIPDPNTYIVRPTSVVLEVRSQVSSNDNTISASLGVYGQWATQLNPVMAALQAIQDRLLNGANQTDDHGNTWQTATQMSISGPSATLNGNIETAGDVDWFKVVDTNPVIAIFPPPQRTYVFETTVNGNMDTVIELYASDGTTLLAQNDDGGNGLASRIVHTTTSGTFYVKVRHYSSSNGTGTYGLTASLGASPPPPPPPAVDDHSNAPQGATMIEVGGATLSGVIEAGGDQDWFQLQQMVIMIFPPPTFTYVIETGVQNGMDTVIELYAADGTTLLAQNDDAPGLGLGSRITYTAQAGTAVYVKVRHFSGNGTGNYTLKVFTTP